MLLKTGLGDAFMCRLSQLTVPIMTITRLTKTESLERIQFTGIITLPPDSVDMVLMSYNEKKLFVLSYKLLL